MPNERGSAAVLALLLAVTLGATAADVGAEMRVEEVAPATFAVLQADATRFNESNSVFVVRPGGVLVVDAQSTLESTLEVIAEIRKRTELPVRHLVLTHWHGDHVHGAVAYRKHWPEVEIVAHTSVDEDIRDRAQAQIESDLDDYGPAIAEAKDRLARRVDRDGQALDEAGAERLAGQIERAEETVARLAALPGPLAVPDLSYVEELVIGSGADAIRLIHFAAHTRGDTVVYLPSARVLVTGDVLDDLPFGGHGYPTGWVEALGRLDSLDFDLIVPGHGRLRRGKEHLRRVRDMFQAILDQVGSAVNAGMDLEATRQRVDLDVFRAALVGDDPLATRAWDDFIPATIERAWLELRGELPD